MNELWSRPSGKRQVTTSRCSSALTGRCRGRDNRANEALGQLPVALHPTTCALSVEMSGGLDRTTIRAEREAMSKALRAVEEAQVSADVFCDNWNVVVAVSGFLKGHGSNRSFGFKQWNELAQVCRNIRVGTVARQEA